MSVYQVASCSAIVYVVYRSAIVFVVSCSAIVFVVSCNVVVSEVSCSVIESSLYALCNVVQFGIILSMSASSGSLKRD